jgi:CheY-like chemotaxis protein
MISQRNIISILLILFGFIIGIFAGLLPGISDYALGGDFWPIYLTISVVAFLFSLILLLISIKAIREEMRLAGLPSGIRVIAIDDEADILRLIRIKLSKEGFNVSTAADGIEGARKVIDEKPDVVLVDVMMPGKDGYEVASEVKKKLGEKAPIVIMLTSKSEDADMVKGLSSGADDYITKPFSPRELVERINVALIKNGRSQSES